MNFEKFVDDIEKNKWAVFGVEVYENSALTHSYGDTNDEYVNEVENEKFVRDYVTLNWFNVADCFVTVGCFLLVIAVLVLEPKKEKK